MSMHMKAVSVTRNAMERGLEITLSVDGVESVCFCSYSEMVQCIEAYT